MKQDVKSPLASTLQQSSGKKTNSTLNNLIFTQKKIFKRKFQISPYKLNRNCTWHLTLICLFHNLYPSQQHPSSEKGFPE